MNPNMSDLYRNFFRGKSMLQLCGQRFIGIHGSDQVAAKARDTPVEL